jgi:NTE family protein
MVGSFRSNTTLREVIQSHRDYWYKTRKNKQEVEDEEDVCEHDVPDLEVYTADLWPSEPKEETLSFDLHSVEDRKWDLPPGNKTDYYEQVAKVVSDCVDLAKQLETLAERKGASRGEITYILEKHARRKNTIGQTRINQELLRCRVRQVNNFVLG